MKAVVMNGIGGRDMREYVERPEPGAGPGEALVEVAFASVNFMDIVIRQGMSWTEVPDPKILGVEGIRPSPGSRRWRRERRRRPAHRVGVPARKLRAADRDPGHLSGAGTRHDRRPATHP